MVMTAPDNHDTDVSASSVAPSTDHDGTASPTAPESHNSAAGSSGATSQGVPNPGATNRQGPTNRSGRTSGPGTSGRPGTAGRRRTPPPEVPTTIQIGVSPAKMMTRGLFGRCPVCGSRHLFRRWVTMTERCPECSFLFERLEGHWIGAIAINTVAVIGLMLILIVGTMIATYPELIPLQLIPILVIVGAAGPFVFYPASKTLWTAVDLLMRPLKWGEVDPRYVVVDPQRDASDKSEWRNTSSWESDES